MVLISPISITILLSTCIASIAAGRSGYVRSERFSAEYSAPGYRNWIQAVLECRSDGEGSTLFRPLSVAEAAEVFDGPLRGTGVDAIWIGLHNYYGNGTVLRTVDGGELDFYARWAPDQPYFPHGSSYFTRKLVSAVLYKNLTMRLEEGENERHFVCKRAVSKSCRRPDKKFGLDYIRVDRFEATYKLYTDVYNVLGANLRCLADGADVFYPDSDEESAAVFEHVVADYDRVMVGLHDYFETGALVGVDGRTDFHANWSHGHPVSGKTRVALLNDTTFESVDYVATGFVCKKKLSNSCPPKDVGPVYSVDANEIFRLVTDRLSHYAAERACREQMGSLAVPRDAAHLRQMIEAFDSHGVGLPSSAWLGFYEESRGREEYVTMEDRLLNNSLYDWVPSDERAIRGCGSLSYLEVLNTTECDSEQAYVCQIETCPSKRAMSSMPIDAGPGTLLLSPAPLSWHDARRFCRRWHSVLASPSDARESTSMAEILTRSLGRAVDAFVGHYRRGPRVVGLRGYEPVSREQKFFDRALANTDDEFCGGIQSGDGLPVALDCNSTRYFFCRPIVY